MGGKLPISLGVCADRVASLLILHYLREVSVAVCYRIRLVSRPLIPSIVPLISVSLRAALRRKQLKLSFFVNICGGFSQINIKLLSLK